jgi:hypothetical protein
MKILHLICLLFLIFLSACTASKTLEYVNAQRGNTGNRGILPADEIEKPQQGKDYFTLELKATRACTVNIIELIVKGYGDQVVLKPVFENNTSKMTLKTAETFYIRVEKERNETVAKPNIETMGRLTMKINGKTQVIEIKEFHDIIPQ